MSFPESWKENRELIRKIKFSNYDYESEVVAVVNSDTGRKSSMSEINEFLDWCMVCPVPAPVKSGYYWAKMKDKKNEEIIKVYADFTFDSFESPLRKIAVQVRATVKTKVV